MTNDDIFYYVEDLILNSSGVLSGSPGSYTQHKVKTVKIHNIKKTYDSFYKIEYSMELHNSIDGFIPNTGKWISSTMEINTNDIKVQRDIKLNSLLRNPDK